MRNKNFISVERLREMVAYDPLTGLFTRIHSYFPSKVGKVAGAQNKCGYIRFSVDDREVLAHQAAVAITTGEWPVLPVDHINGDKSDNRIANLRQVSTQANLQNCLRVRSRSKTGFLGVGRKAGRYRARLYVNGRRHEVTGFETPELAHEFYLLMKEMLHPGYVPLDM